MGNKTEMKDVILLEESAIKQTVTANSLAC